MHHYKNSKQNTKQSLPKNDELPANFRLEKSEPLKTRVVGELSNDLLCRICKDVLADPTSCKKC